jgi:hypothetical protein
MSFDPELIADTVERMVSARLKELADLSDSHGVPFASSVMLSVAADVAGAALAMAKNKDVREGGLMLMSMATKKAMDKYVSEYETQEAIDKAKAL